MAYITQPAIEAKVPAPVLIDALDDDGDGQADDGLLDQIIQNASDAVDGYLAGLYTVPFSDPIPAAVTTATLIFTLEDIYSRRNIPDAQNPFSKQANDWRARLTKIGNRELPLDAATEKTFTPGAVIVENVSINAQST